MISIACRQFSLADQLQFAAVTGDHNPMHVDFLQARRTQAGEPVVHGIHMLLWALDSLRTAQPDLPRLRGLRAQFNKFVYLGEKVEAAVVQQLPTGLRLVLSVNGAARSKLAVDFGDELQDCFIASEPAPEEVAFSPLPLNLHFEQMAGRSGKIPFHMKKEDAATMFPAAAEWLTPTRIAALGASTYLVGMVCPGLHSIYSELSVKLCKDPCHEESLTFHVTETDPRFRSVDQEIAGGGLAGSVKGFARLPPVRQATMNELVGLADPDEFAGSLALIVGGSRGLGELTAKIIATGGGRVLITWQSGSDDAERVASEINAAGGKCETMVYDARKPAAQQFAHLADAPTHAYYFATPGIFRPQASIFAEARLQEFLSVYVDGFWQLTETLRARQPKLSMFYPSSVSVAERPQGMTEYSMAKAAGELLCADMNATMAPAHVTVSRLPRLPTDQTASITAVETASPLATMLPIIREVQSWPR